MKEAITCTDVQLSEIKAEHPEILKSLIVYFIKGMLIYFGYNPQNDSNDDQIADLVNDICEKYYYFHIEDVCLCFKKARQSPASYGKLYGRFDASVVMNWFRVYDKEREDAIHSLPPERSGVKYTGEECSREEYIEILQAKIAGGDLYANELLQKTNNFHQLLLKNNSEYGIYKYQRKHRFDKKK